MLSNKMSNIRWILCLVGGGAAVALRCDPPSVRRWAPGLMLGTLSLNHEIEGTLHENLPVLEIYAINSNLAYKAYNRIINAL